MKSAIYLDTQALNQLSIDYPTCFEQVKESAKTHIAEETTKYIKSKLNNQLSSLIQNSVILKKTSYSTELQSHIKQQIDTLMHEHIQSVMPAIIEENIKYKCSAMLNSHLTTSINKLLNEQLDTLIASELALLLNEKIKG